MSPVTLLTLLFILLLPFTMATSSAIVLYTPDSAPLARFRETSRKITVHAGDQSATVILEQNWGEHGVAGVLWDSAVVLTNFVLNPTSDVELHGKKIVELGSGLGLPSISLSLLSRPSQIIATEQPSAIPLLQRNVHLNGAKTEVVELEWTNLDSSSISNHNFDIILGADLVYKEEAFEPLRDTLRRFAGKNTVIYFASKIRYPKDRRFYRSLSGEFSVEKVMYDRETDVFVYRMRKA